MPVCTKCDSSFPIWITIDGKKRNLKNRKYCLDCSPFGEHNTAQIHKTARPHKGKECPVCGEKDQSKFYKGNKKAFCKSCHNKYTIQKGKEKRSYVIEKLGGKCRCCGFDKYPCSLDIHHTNPAIKDEHFGSFRGWSLDRIDKEIESCILLCRNCHQAYHSGYIPADKLINN